MLQLSDLQTAVETAGLAEFWPRLAAHCRPSIRLLPRASELAEPLAMGRSRLGGRPDLPAQAIWPTWEGRSLSFLAQIKLADLAPYEAATVLPGTGLLSFFYDALQQPWGYDPAQRGQAVVLFHEATALLSPRPLPADLTAEEYTAFPAAAVAFAAEMTLPNPWEEEIGIAADELSEDQRQAYGRLLLFQHGDGTSRLLGNPDALQGPMREECALVTRGINTGSTEARQQTLQAQSLTPDQAAEIAQQTASEWQLLLQLDSHEEEAQMMWGDMGRLYFWINRADLAKHDFSRVWQILQCY
ncbi:YwqG family protein [Hymenobacter terrenus]|uniref:YwqG family protein n=1 Tax=Hymenobacter terrenus TaxID=1629124 RepID=UPI00061907CD|nr:YwqG family protein [Hymenobacter terrenus]